MTIQEASEKYNIPIKILREYERWGLCGEVKKVMGSWHYDNSDIERLSTISWFSHIAVEVPGENISNEWCEPVTDEEYNELEGK